MKMNRSSFTNFVPIMPNAERYMKMDGERTQAVSVIMSWFSEQGIEVTFSRHKQERFITPKDDNLPYKHIKIVGLPDSNQNIQIDIKEGGDNESNGNEQPDLSLGKFTDGAKAGAETTEKLDE